MNAIKFAELISLISKRANYFFEARDLQEFCSIIDEGISPEALPTDVSKEFVGAKLNIIFNMLANGSKIEAIKAVREITGWGLKESKDYIEAWPAFPKPKYDTSA